MHTLQSVSQFSCEQYIGQFAVTIRHVRIKFLSEHQIIEVHGPDKYVGIRRHVNYTRWLFIVDQQISEKMRQQEWTYKQTG